jgi:hypothetical protein
MILTCERAELTSDTELKGELERVASAKDPNCGSSPPSEIESR